MKSQVLPIRALLAAAWLFVASTPHCAMAAADAFTFAPGDEVSIRVYNVDDVGQCVVNGQTAATIRYRGDSDWIDITRLLTGDRNTVTFTLKETGGGWAYGFRLRLNGAIVWEDQCGKAGSVGCRQPGSAGSVKFQKSLQLTCASASGRSEPEEASMAANSVARLATARSQTSPALGRQPEMDAPSDHSGEPSPIGTPEVIGGIVWANTGILFYSLDHTICSYDPWTTPLQPRTVASHSGRVRGLAMSGDGNTGVSTGWDGFLRAWHTQNSVAAANFPLGSPKQTLTSVDFASQDFVANAVCADAHGSRFAVGDVSGVISVFDSSGQSRWRSRACRKAVNALAFDKEASRVLAGGDDGELRLISADTGALLKSVGAHDDGVTQILLLPSGKELLTAGKDGRARRWSYPDLRKLAEYGKHTRAVNAMAMTSDGRFLLTAGSDANVFVHDLLDGRTIGSFTAGEDCRINAIALSPDETHVAFGGTDKTIHIEPLTRIEAFAAAYSAPCELVTTVTFDDSLSFDFNGRLDGAESTAKLVTVTRNTGRGPAYGVALRLSCDRPEIGLTKSQESLGLLMPGATVTREWLVSVPDDVKSGIARFLVETKESQKRDAPRLQLAVVVESLQRPVFEIVAEQWNDGTTGLASGNNNGILENGEAVELTVLVRNVGKGPANAVAGTMDVTAPAGIILSTPSCHVGDVAPGQTKKATFAVNIPAILVEGTLSYNITIADRRGVAHLGPVQRLKNIHVNLPLLTAALSLPSSVSNDRQFDVGVTLRNAGRLSARGVRFTLTSLDVAIPGTDTHLGTLAPGESASERVFTTTVPRQYSAPVVSLRLQASQELGFAGLDTTITIRVEKARPTLAVNAELLGADPSHGITQGQHALLKVLIENRGQLAAKGVTFRVTSNRGSVGMQGISPKGDPIGTIPPNGLVPPRTIAIRVPRGEEPGPLTLTLSLTQDDFEATTTTFACSILEAGAVLAQSPTLSTAASGGPGGLGGAVLSPAPGTSSATGGGIRIMIAPDQPPLSTTSPQLTLTHLSVVSSEGIDRFSIRVNERKWLDETDPQIRAQLRASKNTAFALAPVDINLSVGHNEVIVEAVESRSNQIKRVAFTVNYTPPAHDLTWEDPTTRRKYSSDVDSDIGALNGMDPAPNRCAVIIGIEKYYYASPALYARHDAEAFAAYATAVLGVPANQLFTLYDGDADEYSLSNLFTGASPVTEFLGKHGDQSEVIFYFAGHGVPDYTGKDAGCLLLPANIRPQASAAQARGIRLSKIIQDIRSYKPRFLMVALDACFSGTDRQGRALVEARPGLVREQVKLRGPNEVSFYASGPEELAGSFDDKRHGLFTYFFLKGLRGAADQSGDRNGKITIEEMQKYLRESVSAKADEAGARQHPQVDTGDPTQILAPCKK